MLVLLTLATGSEVMFISYPVEFLFQTIIPQVALFEGEGDVILHEVQEED
jgi:hypothetical protein